MTQLQLNIGARSERGVRTHNNDAVSYWPTESLLLTSQCYAAVADGIGASRSAGEAARLACKTAVMHCAEDGGKTSPRTLLQQAFALSQQQVKTQCIEAMSTLTLIMTRADQLWLAYAGDTRLYRWRDGRLKCLTTDHRSVAAEMGGGLLRAVGLGVAITPDISRHTVQRHDRYAILTDGIYDAISPQRLHELLSQTDDAQRLAMQLIDEALQHGSQDNASALVIDVLESDAQVANQTVTTLASLPLASMPAPGEVIDHFAIESVLAKTRLHHLCVAIDRRRNEKVVIKFAAPSAQDPALARAMLLHEIHMGLQLRHPQLVLAKSPDAKRQTGLYAVFPHIAGKPLACRDRKRYGLRQLLRFGIELAELLQFLHQQQIVHGDIKPENILRGDDGKLYLIDFSVANRIDAFAATNPIGTPNYMAPELWQAHTPTPASDQFALAATLYQLASGGESPYGDIEVFSKPAFKHYQRLRAWRDDLPLWFDVVIERALQRDATARFANCHAFAEALRDGMHHGVGLTETRRRRSWLDRDPLSFYKNLSAALALICFLLLFLLLH